MITKNKPFIAAAYVLMALMVLSCVVPFLLLISSSLTDEATIVVNGYSLIPQKLSFDAYEYLWQARSGILRAYLMSLVVTTVGVLGNVTLTVLYAYPLSRRDLPGRGFFSLFLFFTMLFNGGLVPTYMVYTRIFNVSDSISGLIVPYLLMNAFIDTVLPEFQAALKDAGIDDIIACKQEQLDAWLASNNG